MEEKELNTTEVSENAYAQNGAYTHAIKANKPKNKLIVIIIAVLLIAVVGIFVFVPMVERSKVIGKYYMYTPNSKGEVRYYSGEDYYIELMAGGKCLYEGISGKYTYKSGKLTMTISAFGIAMNYTGTIEDGVITLKETSLFGPSTTRYYKKADAFPG